MQGQEYDSRFLDDVLSPAGEVFLDVPDEGLERYTLRRVEDITKPMDLLLEEPEYSTYTREGRRILARMVVEDNAARRADVRIVETGQMGETHGYAFDISFQGILDDKIRVFLTDSYGNQMESVMPPHVDKMDIKNGVLAYNVSMPTIKWDRERSGRNGTHREPLGIFVGGYQHFHGGSIALLQPQQSS